MVEEQRPGASIHPYEQRRAIEKGQNGLLRSIVQRLRGEFDDFKKETVKSAQSVATRIVVVGEQMMRVFTILGDIESQVETLKTVLIRKDVCSANDFEAAWDEIKGLRVKADGEVITEGDFVRVNFKGSIDGKVLQQEEGFPMRVGAGHLIIEDKIVGRVVGCEPFSVEHVFPVDHQNADLAGKTVTFEVSLGRVKTSIRKESHG